MSVVGIVAEYNPLHEGHAYHMEQARQITGASACVCVLSSNFVQRGEPSVVNKWARTRMALRSGADLVIELPSALSCASAEFFASGAIRLLDSLNCVDALCFGSEEGTLVSLEKAADTLAFESDEFKSLLKKELDKGLSFAVARQRALEALEAPALKQAGSGGDSEEKAEPVLRKPNNILGIEYIKAIRRLGSSIRPVTVERRGQGYHSLENASDFSSATAIRKYLDENIEQNIDLSADIFLKSNLPASTISVLTEEFENGRGPVTAEAFGTLLLYLIRSTPENVLSRLPYMGEGLENRFKQAALESASFGELVRSVVTSRYPAARIKRILMALLTGMTGEFLEALKSNGYAQYIRILGFNDTGRKLLSRIRRKTDLPLLTRPATAAKLQNPLAVKLFEHEARASDAYVLAYPDKAQSVGGSEFRASPVFEPAPPGLS